MENETLLKNDIARKTFSSCYFIFGNDAYLKKFYADKLIDALVDRNDVFCFHSFPSSASLQDVYDALMQMPLFSDRNCVLLTDYDFEKCDKSDFEKLCSLVSLSSEDNVFVLLCADFEFEINKSERGKKLIAATEKAGNKAVLVNHRSVSELTKVIVSSAAKRNCTIDTSDARYLVETVSDDFNIIKNEVEKLCAYQGSGKITRETVDLVCIKSVEESVYNLLSEIIDKKTSSALKMLDDLFFLRTEPLVIFSVISSGFVDIARIVYAESSGKSISAVASDFKYGARSFVLDKMKRNASRFDEKTLSFIFAELDKADTMLKSFSSDEKTALEQLTVRLIYIIEKGEPVD